MTGNYFAAVPVRVPGDWFRTLQSDAPNGLRWFHRDDLHLTLAFFGREDPDHVPAIRAVLKAIPFAGAEITLGPLLPLPNRRRPSALSFALGAGREVMSELIAEWRAPLCEAAGVAAAAREPFPHLTVARPRRSEFPQRRASILAWADSLDPGARPLTVLAPTLFGWSPDRTERQFREIR